MKKILSSLLFVSLFSSCTDTLDEIELKQTEEIQTEKSSPDSSTNTIVDDLNGLIR
ncbi:MAG: hypothetical protein ABJH98_14045 [Reichenbachiella sp.]|uniref:hypothetical protein n=1 Tax=Reichenbachiella sp. TaxID=2184521 RepID=UPI0032990D03